MPADFRLEVAVSKYDEDVFEKDYFQKKAVKDSVIEDDEVHRRLAEYDEASGPPPIYSSSAQAAFSARTLRYPTPLTGALKWDIINAAWKVPTFQEANPTVHPPSEDLENWIPDQPREQVVEYPGGHSMVPLESIDLDAYKNQPWSSLNEKIDWYLRYENILGKSSEAEQKHYAAYRNPNIQMSCLKLPERDTQGLCNSVAAKRQETYDELKAALDERYKAHIRRVYGRTVQELEDLGWMSEGADGRPVLAKGGFFFREWKDDLDGIIVETGVKMTHDDSAFSSQSPEF